MKTNLLQAIFFDEYQNWERFKKKHHRKIRSIVKTEIEKFRLCGDIRKGYRLFVCEGCGEVKFYPLRCKGKFCPSCAVGESQKWAEIVSNDMLSVNHRHVVFISNIRRNFHLKKRYYFVELTID